MVGSFVSSGRFRLWGIVLGGLGIGIFFFVGWFVFEFGVGFVCVVDDGFFEDGRDV